jgi:hypothetical protein
MQTPNFRVCNLYYFKTITSNCCILLKTRQTKFKNQICSKPILIFSFDSQRAIICCFSSFRYRRINLYLAYYQRNSIIQNDSENTVDYLIITHHGQFKITYKKEPNKQITLVWLIIYLTN